MKIKLRMENVTKTFGSLVAVNNLSLDVMDGEFVCYVGPSGCGKTTTLNMLSGLETPDEGRIFLDDKLLNNVPAKSRDIGLIFQDYAIFDNMNVYENLAFSLRVRKVSKREVDRVVNNVAERFYLREILDKDVNLLSPGELQRIAIGRTVIMGPSVYLLDEPLDNLDADMRITMRAELKRFQKELGSTMIYVTHDQEEAMSLADRLMIMNHGELQQFDTPEKVYNKPINKFVASFIGSYPINFFSGIIQEISGKLTFIDKSNSMRLNVSEYKHYLNSVYGNNVLVGIRPEHIYVSSTRDEGQDMDIVIDNLEVLGPENVIEFHFENDPEVLYKAVIPPEITPEVGHKIYARVNRDKTILVDRKSEEVITRTEQ